MSSDADARWSVAQGDAVEWLRSLAPGSVDLVITDPAYESLEKHRKIGTTTRLKHSAASSNDWFEIFPNARFADLFCEMYRVLAADRHAYVMCDQETMFVAKPIAEAAGFEFLRPLVWDKMRIGMGYHYRARYEMVLHLAKGDRAISAPDLGDIVPVPRVRNGYPTEKPVALCDYLVRQSSVPGELVIDPFMGSGSAGVAAIDAGRRFAGNDLSGASIALALASLTRASGAPTDPALHSAPPRLREEP